MAHVIDKRIQLSAENAAIFSFRIPLFVLSKRLCMCKLIPCASQRGKKMKIHHCGLNCLRRENIHATFYIYADINLPYKGV